MRVGGIVLCGGRSSRMGQPKFSIPFGDETLLQRAVRTLRSVVDPVVVVAALDQQMPELPYDVAVLRDETPFLGPLAGIAAGLAALRDRVEAAYVTACDTPLLTPEFVRSLVTELHESGIAFVSDGEFHHPLAAVYRTSLARPAAEFLRTGQRRLLDFVGTAQVRVIDAESLRQIDPELRSLRNINTKEDLQIAKRVAGIETEEV
jgi:molybdopterin-guanine dinucleotide biosynthesis protein A